MNVTRNVIVDLSALVESGEASADSKALVDSFLSKDPELRSELERASRADAGVRRLEPKERIDERDLMNRVVRVVRRRNLFLNFALLITLLPLSFSFGSSGFHFALEGHWLQAVPAWLSAIPLWWGYFRFRGKAVALGVGE